MISHEIEFSGFAGRSDLDQTWCIDALTHLEDIQAEFLAMESRFRSPEYQWPRDPLHTWSRIWEYPYAHEQLRRLTEKDPDRRLQVVDYGSGVTFFPFAIARLGCDVTCADIDPICGVDIPKVTACLPTGTGTVAFSPILDSRISLPDESQDVVYCISVIEHIPFFENSILDISRVLKPGGTLIFTIDIDMKNNFGLGINAFNRLQDFLKINFVSLYTERSIHPLNLLTTRNSKIPMPHASRLRQLLSNVYHFRKNTLTDNSLFLSIYASTHTKAHDFISSTSL